MSRANSPQTNVVLTIHSTTWFGDGAGRFLDPRVSRNQRAIEKNNKASTRAFEEEDNDGEDDDDNDGNDGDGEDD